MDAKILIVEDERDIVDFTAIQFTRSRFRNRLRPGNGADALHRAVERSPGPHFVRLDAPRGGRSYRLSSPQERSTDEKIFLS